MAVSFKRFQLIILLTAFALLILAHAGTVESSKTSIARSIQPGTGRRAKTLDSLLMEERASGFITSSINALKKRRADHLFIKLKVNQLEPNLFASAEFQAWVSAVTKTSKNKPQFAEELMVSTLSKRLGHEALAKILVATKKDGRFATLAGSLEKAQFTNWLTQQQTLEDVFKLLKLDQVGNKLLESPVFSVWYNYVALSSTNQLDAMIKVLGSHYDDDILVNMIAAGKKSTASVEFDYSRKVEEALFEKWITSKSPKSESDEFELVGLKDIPVDDLLKSSKFSIWMSYVQKVKTTFRLEDVRAFYVLRARGDYNELDLAMVLGTAKSSPYTEEVKQFAKDLQLEQFKVWRDDGWTPNIIEFMGSSHPHDERLDQVLTTYEAFCKVSTILN